MKKQSTKMMKTIASFVFILFCVVSVNAQTSWMVEAQVAVSPENEQPIYPQPWIWGARSFKDTPWGVGCFALVGRSWGELLIGPSYTFGHKTGFTEIGIQGGIETFEKSPLRSMAYVFHQKTGEQDGRGQFSMLLIGEYGGSGWWHIGFVNYNFTKSIGLGLIAQHSTVYGPRLQVNIPSGFVWFGVGQDIENNKPGGVVGLRFFM